MKIKIQCAWCRKYMGTKESEDTERTEPLVSHSICPDCRKSMLTKMHAVNH